jgi:hypothetical protein
MLFGLEGVWEGKLPFVETGEHEFLVGCCEADGAHDVCVEFVEGLLYDFDADVAFVAV